MIRSDQHSDLGVGLLYLLGGASIVLLISHAAGAVRAQQVPSMARVAAGAFGFLTLIQAFDFPDR